MFNMQNDKTPIYMTPRTVSDKCQLCRLRGAFACTELGFQLGRELLLQKEKREEERRQREDKGPKKADEKQEGGGRACLSPGQLLLSQHNQINPGVKRGQEPNPADQRAEHDWMKPGVKSSKF